MLINRIESAHWSLKRLIQNSMGGLCKYWDAMNNLITLQHIKIKASFEKSIHFMGHNHNVQLYKRLHRFISRYALNYIKEKLD